MEPSNPQTLSRKQIRSEIERILSQTVLRNTQTANAGLTSRRIAARRSLSFRIERSLYRRAPDMDWYNDREALQWRVVKIAQEMLYASIRREEQRAVERQRGGRLI
ncbi:hypothetical protein ACHAWO_009658 [Cyclotella atomus]|uniref:Uncharacterized protein n=1 Tax=Cyclotella atomus TaxID=382360 RepID=A0ABD3PFC4_9STRA